MKASLEAVKEVYKSAKYKGIGCGIKSTGPWQRHDRRRLHHDPRGQGPLGAEASGEGARLEILNGYTEMGQGIFTATMQAVCEETGLLARSHARCSWDKELGGKCGETWASRGTTLSCAAAADRGAEAGGGSQGGPAEAGHYVEHECRTQRDSEASREGARRSSSAVSTDGEYVLSFTTRPGTPEWVLNPTTHLTFSYSTQVVILDEEGKIERVVAAHDVGRAINPRLCAEQMEGGVHMGLGYALSEDFPSTGGVPDSLALRDLGIVPAKQMPDDRRDSDRGARRSRRLRGQRSGRNRLRRDGAAPWPARCIPTTESGGSGCRCRTPRRRGRRCRSPEA